MGVTQCFFTAVSPFPRSHLSRALTFPALSPFPRSHLSRALTFPSLSPFPRSHLSRALTFPALSPFPRSHLSFVRLQQRDKELPVAVEADHQAEGRAHLHVRARVLDLHVLVHEELVLQQHAVVLEETK
jgi:hypothetical protein